MTAQEQQMVDMLLKTNASQVELLSKQSKQIESLEQRIKELTAQIAWFQRQMFGRKSEKLAAVDPNQLSLFDEPEIPVAVQQAQEEATQQIEKESASTEKKRARENRKLMKNLPVLERVVLKPEGIDLSQ